MDAAALLRLAHDALARYDITGATLVAVAGRSDARFRVERRGAPLLLRLHLSGHVPGVDAAEWALAIESELVWLDALGRDTGLAIPRPLRTSDGGWIASAGPDDRPAGLASLLSWVEGRELVDGANAAAARALGETVATLHDYAETWTPPERFRRPVHDTARTAWAAEMMRRAAADGVIGAGDASVVEQVLARVRTARAGLPRTPRHWGMLHGDLYRGNMVVHGSRVGLIDFSLCGFGLYAQDLGSAVAALDAPLARTFVEAYDGRRPLGPDSLAAIEACAIETRIAGLGVAAGNPDDRSRVSRAVPALVATACRRFLEAS